VVINGYGLGLAYFSEKFNDGEPIEANWINKKDSQDFTALVNYQDAYQDGAARYSVGEQSNFTHVAMLLAGLKQILDWEVKEIQNYCKDLHQLLITELEDTDYQVQAIGASSSHLTGIRISTKMNMETIKRTLTEHKIFVSYRGDAIRVSFHVFNDQKEVKKFAEVLKAIWA